MKKIIFKLQAVCSCVVCLALFTACSWDVVDSFQERPEDQNIQKLVSLKFDKDTVQLSPEDLQDTGLRGKDYRLLDNGDYEFIYFWPFQTVRVVVHNTENYSFGDPSNPLMEFSHYKDNIYKGTVQIELTYSLNGNIKTHVVRGKFTAIVK